MGFVVVELAAGLVTGSLALVADAGHNLSDVLALVLAWTAMMLGQRRASQRRTYGWGRSSILAALANALLLLIVIGAVAWEAIDRLNEPTGVPGETVIVVALIGTVVNAAAAFFFLEGREHDANLRGAFLHLASDAAVSLGVGAAGVAMIVTGWLWLDPVASLLISVVVVVVATLPLLRDAANLALDAVPRGIDTAAVRAYLEGLPEVVQVHDFHVWGMSTTVTALTAHLVLRELPRDDALLEQIADDLRDRFGIQHSTLQLEHDDPAHPCILATAHL